MTSLTLGYSPCPNDTFIFTAWTHGLLPTEPEVVERLEDIDTLNGLANATALDVVKVSFHALGHLREDYCLLHSGGALGRGCGPLLVARNQEETKNLVGQRIAIPGAWTTAALLLRLYAPEATDLHVMPFHEIMPAVQNGAMDAGLIIHESRFTYPRFGLTQIVDLGEWWERETGKAIPLGGIVAKRSLGRDRLQTIDRAIRSSLNYARENPDAIWPTIRSHAQEMEDDVMRQHIELYVNDFSVDYGVEGEEAIRHLLATAERLEVIQKSAEPLFWDGC